MMKLIPLFALPVLLYAQTTVYLRDSPPASVVVTNATNATPIVLTTASSHGFASVCGVSTTCYCDIEGVSSGVTASPINGIHECHYVDGTHVSLYDLTNTAIAGNGAYWSGLTPFSGTYTGQWLSQVTPLTTAAEPIGFLDGPSGQTMRRLAIYNGTGLAGTNGIKVTGCPSACVITVATTYNPLTGQGNFPVAAGQHFSVTGTGTSLDTCGDGTASSGAQSPYTMASVSSSGWVSNSFACSISNGDYTNQATNCGNNGSTYDAINGSSPCPVVSQLATAVNPMWTQMLAYQSTGGFNAYPNYKYVFDGGNHYPDAGPAANAAYAALRLYVDRTPGLTTTCCSGSFWLAQVLYYLTNLPRVGGSTFVTNEGANVDSSNTYYIYQLVGFSLLYDAALPYWNPTEKTTFLNQMYNDVDDPTVTACTKTNTDASATSNHNWVLATGTVQSGTNDATHVTLASSAHCHIGTIISLQNSHYGPVGPAANSYGLVTACSVDNPIPGEAVATVASWSGASPTLDNLVSGTVSSIANLTSVTGTTGQACVFNAPGGTSNAQITVPLSGTNTISNGAAITVNSPGYGYSSAPTTTNTNYSAQPYSASCIGYLGLSTVIGTPYTVFDTYTTDDSAAGVTAVATFTQTSSLSSTVNVGDTIMAYNGWYSIMHTEELNSIVTMVGSGNCATTNHGNVSLSANQLCIINADHTTASSTAQMAWRFPAWTSGDCGLIWAMKHGDGGGTVGAPNYLYNIGTYGQTISMSGATGPIAEGGNLGAGDPGSAVPMDLAAAADDSRAVRDLTRNQSWLFDYWERHYTDYLGFPHSGSGYSWDGVVGQFELHQFQLSQSVPTYTPFTPNDMGVATMFQAMPDLIYGYPTWFSWGGTAGWYTYSYGSPQGIGVAFDQAFYRNPTGNTASFLRNWMEHVASSGSQSTLNFWGANGVEGNLAAQMFLHTSPTTPDADYTTQPRQWVSSTSNAGQCASLSGWPCNEFRGDVMISRGPWATLTSSFLFYESRTFNGDSYDTAMAGGRRFYKTSPLLWWDEAGGTGLQSQGSNDASILADVIQFGGPQSSWGVEFNPSSQGGNKANITAWASANAGTLGSAYGDSSSRYAYVCSNVAAIYNSSLTIPNYVNRCTGHLKASGHDEFMFAPDDISIPSALAINTHLHYYQTGQTIQFPGATSPTGTTTCIDSSGTQVSCTSALNSNRIIESVEYGGESSSGQAPNQTFGVISEVFSPNTIYVHWDCPGSGNAPQCTHSPLNTYTGGNGWTDRVEVGAGTSSASTATAVTWMVTHKTMQSLSDTTFTANGFQPDANWYGSAACGALSCAVMVQGLGNSTHATLTTFTPTLASTSTGAVDWIIGGVTPGTYTVTVGGTAVSGSPFTVSAGDTSIYFSTSGGGALALTQTGGVGGAFLGGQFKGAGGLVIH